MRRRLSRRWAATGSVVLLTGCSAGTYTLAGDGAEADLCDDGSVNVAATLQDDGPATGTLAYRELPGGCREFVARVESFAQGTYNVTVLGTVVGAITVGDGGDGELAYDSDAGNFPSEFPSLRAGDTGSIAGLIPRVFRAACPSEAERCGSATSGTGDAGG